MAQQEENIMKSRSVINVRKLTALDIVFHGPRLILAEFTLGTVLCAILGLWSFLSPIYSPFMIIIGSFFLWVALNYVLLLFAKSIVKRKSAHQEMAFELAHEATSARKYALQTTTLLLVLPQLAMYQEVHHRSHQGL